MTAPLGRETMWFERLRAGVLASVVLVAGCATQTDIQDVAREQRRIRTQLADTRASVEELQRDIAKLSGNVEEVRHSTRGRESGSRLESLEARIAALEQGRGADPTAQRFEEDLARYLGVPSGTPGPTPTPARAEVSASELAREEAREVPAEYRKGLTLLRQGAYDRAIPAFRDFLRTNPDSPLVPSAHYWIGESYTALGDTQQAILNYYEVRKSPKNEHAPAAILKIGLAFLRMGNKSEARLAFQKVVNDYPSSPEAAQAREKLQAPGT